VPCRVALDRRAATAAAARVRERVREAIRHYDVPVDAVVDALGAARDPSRHPFFRVAFGLGIHDSRGLPLAGCEVRREPFDLGHARFDLTLRWSSATAASTSLELRARPVRAARRSSGSRTPTPRSSRRWRAPGTPLDALPMMDARARGRLRRAASGADDPIEGEEVVHRRFAAQAAARPEARAIGALTYAALDVASSRLAASCARAASSRAASSRSRASALPTWRSHGSRC
jgi:non-ribosomal peptide synthetase component F